MEGEGFQQEFRIELDSLNSYIVNDYKIIMLFASYVMKIYQDDYGYNMLKSIYDSKENLTKYKPWVLYLRPFYNSSHRLEVISLLKYLCCEHPDPDERGRALGELRDIADPQFYSFAYDISKTDTVEWIRNVARYSLKGKSPLFWASLNDALGSETKWRGQYYAEFLRSDQVWAYKYILDLYKDNIYPADSLIIKDELNSYDIYLIPPSDVRTSVLLDSLHASLSQVQNYNWIGNQNFVIELNEDLLNAQSNLNAGDSINCARRIRTFQQKIDEEYNDTLDNDNKHITFEGWNYLHYSAQYIIERLPHIPPDPILINITPSNVEINSSSFTLMAVGKNFMNGSLVYWNGAPKSTTYLADTLLHSNIITSDIAIVDSPLVTVRNPDDAESNSIRFYIKPRPQFSGCVVKLIDGGGERLSNGTLQYYAGSWKDAFNNNDGTFTITTTAKTLSLRMTYEYGSQTKSNVPVGSDAIIFQTVNAQIKLENSQGTPIDTGTVQYYAGAWRNLGTTTNGITSKELLPGTYSFRMTYAYASKDKQQDISANPIVVFQTVNTAVQLQNSQGSMIDQGSVQYYSGAWRNFGVTTGGTATKELLPNNYSFRMTYSFASKDKQQDIGTNSTVVFQSVNAAVQLKNSQGNLIDVGTVQYYSGAWREFGTTSNGVANKELLPNNYSFRMSYAFASKDKQQDLSSNPVVVFQTVNAKVQLQNSMGTFIDQGTVQYYSGAWRSFGTTTNGVASKELLQNNYTFRMTHEYVSNDKAQDLSANSTVSFSTVLCMIKVKNSQNQPVNNAMASYYSGAWRQIGNTVNGEVTKELLPANLTFRAKLGTVQQDKAQNLSTNSVVEFIVQ
jgi:hypothetical protein